MRNSRTKGIALSGILAAVAVVIMLLGGLIPLSTYSCPLICCIICFIVHFYCGSRLAWAWYITVSLLSLLLGPDPEASVVFVCLGFYPNIRLKVNRSRFRIIWKLLIFNGAVCVISVCMLLLVGFQKSFSDYSDGYFVWLLLLLLLGNTTFFFLDKLLSCLEKKLLVGG